MSEGMAQYVDIQTQRIKELEKESKVLRGLLRTVLKQLPEQISKAELSIFFASRHINPETTTKFCLEEGLIYEVNPKMYGIPRD